MLNNYLELYYKWVKTVFPSPINKENEIEYLKRRINILNDRLNKMEEHMYAKGML